ncbi:MAG: FMN-binding protein, partial [Verrucomicrobiaceae bacterium]
MARSQIAASRRHSVSILLTVVLCFGALFFWMQAASAVDDLNTYLPKVAPADFFPEAVRFGTPQGNPAIVPALKDDEVKGFVYLNSDFANATGYSGKPIHLLVGITTKGVVTGFKMVEHKEPIVLLGIPEKRVVDAVNKLVGADMDRVARGTAPAPQVDIVSGATVTVLVMG